MFAFAVPATASTSTSTFLSCRRAAARALMLACCVTAAGYASAQNTAQDSAQAKTAQQAIAPPTTTVVVHGEVNGDYMPEAVTVGTLDGEALRNAPLSATVITRDLMSNQQARLLSDVVKNDASIQDDYVPVGYYGWYEIRGYPIDLATGLEINGMTIAGEQDVPLENKERVELLNGLAGVESGVAAGGGLINYVTKPVTLVKALDFATDQYGTAYGAADLGRYFGSRKQVGARVNLAGERIETYMNGTAGWRAAGAGATEWKIAPQAALEGNFEYQHKTEADGSGYQLLGGTTLPDINRIYRSTLLGQQSWVPPDTYDVFNASVRLNATLTPKWTGFVSASLSHSLIQDNVIYAYGCGYEAECAQDSGPGQYPSYFFAPDGTYDIYDYRSPGELRIDGVAEAMTSGQVKTGKLTHFITAGGELFLRSVQMPGTPPANAPDNVQDGAVYAYVGSENIYQPDSAFPIEVDPITNTPDQAGPRTLWEDDHQGSFVLQDRVQLPGRIQLIAGGRYDALRDHNYSAYATDPTAPMNPTDKPVWLPQFAATFNPGRGLTLYGNYGVLLSLGPQGPWWTDNTSQFLSPFNTRQAEVGAKWQSAQSILVSADYFHMRAPFFYPKVIQAPDAFCPADVFQNPGDMCFEEEGRETHDGFEMNAQGKAASWLRLSASMTAMSAVSSDTGTPAFDNQQVINVARLRSVVFADVRLSGRRGLYVMPGWSLTSRKEATRDDAVSVPAYNLFNLGLRYTPGGEQGHTSFRVYASNVGDKKYWSDTGGNGGDSFLWLGAPAWVRASVHYTF